MPLILNSEYEFSETTTDLTLTVPRRQICPKSTIDVLITSNYVKIVSSPFLNEWFLADEIDDDLSSFRVHDQCIIINLRKKNPKIWSAIENSLLTKSDKHRIRVQSVEFAQLKYRERVERLQTDRKRIAKRALDAEMKKEAEDRAWEAAQKKEIIANALNDLQRQTMTTTETNTRNRTNQCPIRSTANLKVTFSERKFPTASRESTAAAEHQWLTENDTNTTPKL